MYQEIIFENIGLICSIILLGFMASMGIVCILYSKNDIDNIHCELERIIKKSNDDDELIYACRIYNAMLYHHQLVKRDLISYLTKLDNRRLVGEHIMFILYVEPLEKSAEDLIKYKEILFRNLDKKYDNLKNKIHKITLSELTYISQILTSSVRLLMSDQDFFIERLNELRELSISYSNIENPMDALDIFKKNLYILNSFKMNRNNQRIYNFHDKCKKRIIFLKKSIYVF